MTSPLCYLGINFTLCWICGYVLIKKKTKTLRIMLGIVILQWMISTVHVSLGFTVRIFPPHWRIRNANPDISWRSDWFTGSFMSATSLEALPPIFQTFPFPATLPRCSSILST